MLPTQLLVACLGHGALVNPQSRNAIDRRLPRSARTPVHAPSCTNLTGHAGCDNGQAQYWYSQGCFIGCPACDHVSGRRQTDLCGLGKHPTINAPEHRTVNRAAPAGSALDIYRHNPWRAPGSAPVADACGLAGGTPWGKNVSEWGDYVPTIFAKHWSCPREKSLILKRGKPRALRSLLLCLSVAGVLRSGGETSLD